MNGSLDVAALPLTALAGLNPIRDALALGAPVLLALSLDSGQTTVGSHFVAAIGVAGNGDILVHDPNPIFRRNTLNEYLQDFNTSGRTWRGRLTAALRLIPQNGSALGFPLSPIRPEAAIISQAGSCGFCCLPGRTPPPPRMPSPQAPDRCVSVTVMASRPTTSSTSPARPAAISTHRFGHCRRALRIDAESAGRIHADAANFHWTAAPQQLAFAASAVLNAATFRPELSPGTIVSVFGSGLSATGRATAVSVDGQASTVLASTPFQVNFQIPPGLSPGEHTLRIESPFGAAEQSIALAATSPGIFTLGGGRARRRTRPPVNSTDEPGPSRRSNRGFRNG